MEQLLLKLFLSIAITMGSVDIIGPLFQPLRLGALSLSHRVVQAPCTRMRSTKESDGVFVPNDLNVEYYSQRASEGGFMLTEATPISRYVCFLSFNLFKINSNTQFLISIGSWVPWSSWYLHRFSDCRVEKGHRRRTRKGRLHLLSIMARWSCHRALLH